MIRVFHAELLQEELDSDFDATRISMAAMATHAEIHGAQNTLSLFMQCHMQNMDVRQPESIKSFSGCLFICRR